MLYASSAAILRRLAIGAAGTLLMSSGGIPAWATSLTGAYIFTGTLIQQQLNTNAVMEFRLNNPSGGASAAASLQFYEDTVQKFSIFVGGSGASGYLGGAEVVQLWNYRNSPILFATNNTRRGTITAAGSLVWGIAALATTATDGFIYLPTSAGLPTGVPTSQTGTAAFEYDSTNNALKVYDGGWIGVAVAGFALQKLGKDAPELRMMKLYHEVEDKFDESRCPLCKEQMRPGEPIGLVGDSYYQGGGLHCYGAHLRCLMGVQWAPTKS